MSCKCQECGKQYKSDFLIDNKLWGKIKPANKSKGAGLLCGKCIIEKIEKLIGYSAWKLTEIK